MCVPYACMYVHNIRIYVYCAHCKHTCTWDAAAGEAYIQYSCCTRTCMQMLKFSNNFSKHTACVYMARLYKYYMESMYSPHFVCILHMHTYYICVYILHICVYYKLVCVLHLSIKRMCM